MRTPAGSSTPSPPTCFQRTLLTTSSIRRGKAGLVRQYLKRACPDPDTYKAVVLMMGLMMADSARFEVFFQLYGKGSNGKTVLLDIIEALVGRQNVSQVALESLAPGTRFQSFPLVAAKANISGELPPTREAQPGRNRGPIQKRCQWRHDRG